MNEKAKKEAKELVEKFLRYTPVEYEYEYAKHCALLTVNEIKKSLQRNIGYTQCKIDLEYYLQVEIEIEKL